MESTSHESENYPVAYTNSFDHLRHELHRLDMLIHLRILEQRSRQASRVIDQYKGLVLWDEEIDDLLERDSYSPSGEPDQIAEDAEFQALAERLRQLESDIEERRARSVSAGVFLALDHLYELFKLNSFEAECLLICLAPEVDRKYEKLYGYLHDDVTRRKPSLDLALNLLCNRIEEKLEARLAFESASPLLSNSLLQIIDDPNDAPSPLLTRSLKLDDRIAAFLLGSQALDARLEFAARLISYKEKLRLAGSDSSVGQRLRDLLHFVGKNSVTDNAVLYFYGPYGSGKCEVAEESARALGVSLILADAEKMADGSNTFEETADLLIRETRLQSAALAIENFDILLGDDQRQKSQLRFLFESIRSLPRPTFLLGSKLWAPQERASDLLFIACQFPTPDNRERESIWRAILEQHPHLATDDELGALADKFRFTQGQIRDAITSAYNTALWRTPAAPEITLSDLYSACRSQSSTRLGKLARKVDPKYCWQDIVLPEDQRAQLREICDQIKTRRIVYGEWGFDKKLSLGKGLNVLFSGPPGTGKTMAAEVIAKELGLDLYRIDLSQVVSKYIGETEKNLSQIFTEAQSSNAILFFDEADALFGKRSEVKDAHDRYANIEIGYLLQQMEEYDGIAILATNLRQNMDEAFVRRLQIIIEFPFPDEEHRKLIWQVIFPAETPVSRDVDFSLLAREIKLAGGNIKNIAVCAAFYAASYGGSVTMPRLIEATRREYQKMGWPWNETEWSRKSISVS